jgi:general secretion pathway protein L
MATMFRSVVGLDIGSYAVKAVVLRGALRPAALAGATRLEEGDAPLAARLSTLAERTRLAGDDVLTALPGHRVSTRLLRFPAASARRIDQAVPFELESQIPFPLDQVVVAHRRVSPPGAAEVEVLAAAAQAADLSQLLEACAAARLEPRRVDLDAAALGPVATAVPPEAGAAADAATAVVDLGATKTGVAVVAAGRLRFVRTVLSGGHAITRALAQGLGVPEANAEALKRDALTGGSEVRAALARALEPLAAELHKTLVSYRQTGGPEVRRLLLVGGGAALAGLPETLGRTLEIPARVVTPAAIAGLGAQAASLGPEYTPAVALALGGAGRGPAGLDFRRGPFAYRKAVAGLRRRLAVSAGLAAAILLLLGVDFYTEYRARAERYGAIQAQVRQAYREVFPDGPLPPNEALALRSQTDALKKELAQIGGLAGGQVTPLVLLAEISRRLTPEMKIDVLEFTAERNQVRLRAETTSFEMVDRMKAELLKFPLFTDIQVSDARMNPNQTSVGFRFTVTLSEEV